MKSVQSSLETYLNTAKNITSCDLFEIRLQNGNSYLYADTDMDISYNGKVYIHDGPIVKRKQTETSGKVTVDNMTVDIQTDRDDKIETKPFLQAAHDGTLDKAKLYLRRCFFRDQSILGVIDLFSGNVEIKEAGGIRLQLSVKAETQGLSMEFPVRKYYPQGSYTTGADGIIYSKETDAATLIAPFVPLREVLI